MTDGHLHWVLLTKQVSALYCVLQIGTVSEIG